MLQLTETSTEISTETAERVNGFFLGYIFAFLEIDVIRDEFSLVDFEKSTARLNINTRYRHDFSYKFYHSVVADPDPEGFVRTKEGNLDERSLSEWAKQIEITSPHTTPHRRVVERLQLRLFNKRQDKFKRLQNEGRQKCLKDIFGTSDNFLWRSEDPTGIVYLMGCDRSKTLKIGYTTDIDRRLKELQRDYHFPLRVLATREGTMKAEKRLLNSFKRLRVKGEWFDWDDSIIAKF